MVGVDVQDKHQEWRPCWCWWWGGVWVWFFTKRPGRREKRLTSVLVSPAASKLIRCSCLTLSSSAEDKACGLFDQVLSLFTVCR